MNILIVDDIIYNRILLIEIMKSLGYNSLQAANGKEAIDLIKETDINLVLMDIEMPVMNGLETTLYIRNKLNNLKNKVPIIALTAHDPNDFFEDFNATGFNDLLTKPYTINRISDIIQKNLVH